MSDAGDVNGDGFDDFMVGMPRDGSNGTDSGAAHLYSGVDGSLIYNILGFGVDSRAGTTLCGMGDINNDGFDDFAVGETNFNTVGATTAPSFLVHIFSGQDGSILFQFQGPISSSAPEEIANAGDVNDLIIGVPNKIGLPGTLGVADVVSGNDASTLHTILGVNDNGSLGSAVDGIGDANGDGFADFIVGAPNGTSVRNFGRARVYSAANAAILRNINSQSQFNAVGESVAGLGDIAGDGAGDYAVSQGKNPQPIVCLFSGASGTSLGTIPSPLTSNTALLSVSGIGDVNADGRDDVFVSTMLSNLLAPAPENDGRLRVFLSGVKPIAVYSSASGNSPALALSWVPEAEHPNDETVTLFVTGRRQEHPDSSLPALPQPTFQFLDSIYWLQSTPSILFSQRPSVRACKVAFLRRTFRGVIPSLLAVQYTFSLLKRARRLGLRTEYVLS